MAFIKNGTLMLIRPKVPFPSSLFFAIRVKKPQITFSSRSHSFATNSNKSFDFTHNFAHLALGSLSVKSFSRIPSSRHHFLTLTNQSGSKKTRRQNHASEPIRDCLIKELNIRSLDGDLLDTKFVFSTQYSSFLTKPCHFFCL